MAIQIVVQHLRVLFKCRQVLTPGGAGEAETVDGEEKKEDKAPKDVKDYWLKKNIVVKIVTKSLGEKYYKQKARVREVVERYTAVLSLLESGAKVKVDQDHLETVVPALGKEVLVVNGRHRGDVGLLKAIDVDRFCATVEVFASGDNRLKEVELPYEHFSKLHSEK